MPSDECGLRPFLGLHESTNSDVSCDSQVTTMPDRDEDTKPEKASAFLHSPHSHRTSNQLPSHLGERLHSSDGEAARNGRDGRTSASTTARRTSALGTAQWPPNERLGEGFWVRVSDNRNPVPGTWFPALAHRFAPASLSPVASAGRSTLDAMRWSAGAAPGPRTSARPFRRHKSSLRLPGCHRVARSAQTVEHTMRP